MGGDPPPDDGAGVGVDDEAGVGHPGPRRDVGEVGDPQLVRSGRGEVPLHQIRVPLRRDRRSSAPDLLGPPDAFDPRGPHQPGDLVTPDLMADAAGGLPQLPGAMTRELSSHSLLNAGVKTSSRWARAESGRLFAA